MNCEGHAETVSQNKLVSMYLVPTLGGLPVVCMGEDLLSWQEFGMWNKGSHIHGMVFVKIVW